MPSHFGPTPEDDSDDDDVYRLRKDEYGERFEDYGFVKRAEEHKAAGNAAFQKERYEKALQEYESALDQLITVAYDKSIVLGKKKWNDIIVLRSTIRLNKSTCYYKLGDWKRSSEEAHECLVGNVREEALYTDPHIRQKIKSTERKTGQTGVTFVEQRLPRSLRAKAWFRLSRCNANLGFLDRAKETLAKAMETCEDRQLLTELSQHSLRIDVLEKEQKQRQKKQFAGFWDKLQDRGGYAERDSAKKASKLAWDTLNYDARFGNLTEEPGADKDRSSVIEQAQVRQGVQAALQEALPSQMQDGAMPPLMQSPPLQSLPPRQPGDDDGGAPVDSGFDDTDLDGRVALASAPMQNVSATPQQRPCIADEAPLRWSPEAEDPSRSLQEDCLVEDPQPPDPNRYAEAWRQKREQSSRARAQEQAERAKRVAELEKRQRLEALDDSDAEGSDADDIATEV